jgi:hypothetical protein
MPRVPRPLALGLGLAAAAFAACGPFGGDGAPFVLPPDAPKPSASDSLLVLVPLRDEVAIRQEIDEYKAQMLAAESSAQMAKLMQARAQTAITVKEAQRQSMQANLDLAESEKNEIAKSEWRGRMRLAELEKNLLEQREELRGTEIQVARAQRDHAAAHVEALEAELQLSIERGQRGAFAGREPSPEVVAGLARLDSQIQSLEKETLERHVESARRREKLAGKEADLAQRRLKVLEAQIQLMRGR